MPFDEEVNAKPVLTLDASDFPALDGAKAGQMGKLSCEFRVMEDELSGTVQLELIRPEIETKNAADKDMEAMVGPEQGQSEALDDEENDDI